MASFDYDLGVIGAGAAGLTITAGAAQLGVKTALFEKREKLGGDCLHYGCVPSKTLIRSAHVYHLMRRGAAFGLPEVDIPPVDFAKVAARIRDVIATIQPNDSVERFCTLGAQVKFGQVEFVDEHSVALHGKTISADKWIIASGARPGAPPIPGLDAVDYLTNETLFTMERLPSAMIILGAGPIAVEMAQAFQRLGCQVTVIQRSGQILSNEDKDVADIVQAALERDGVAIHTGMATTSVRQEGDERVVTAEDAQGVERAFRAPALLVALGRRANVDTMKLENAGVEFTPKGVDVDDKMRTNQSHIFAIGDVTGKHQFTHAAGYEGGVALSNALIHFPRKADYTWMPRATYTDPELAAMGKTEAELEAEGVAHDVWTEYFSDNDRSLAEGNTEGKLKLILDKKEKPLGVQIVGPNAGELLGEWAVAMGAGVKLSTLASITHPYPTLSEISKRIAGDVMAPKLFQGLLPKGLKLIFNYKGRACEWTAGAKE